MAFPRVGGAEEIRERLAGTAAEADVRLVVARREVHLRALAARKAVLDGTRVRVRDTQIEVEALYVARGRHLDTRVLRVLVGLLDRHASSRDVRDEVVEVAAHLHVDVTLLQGRPERAPLRLAVQRLRGPRHVLPTLRNRHDELRIGVRVPAAGVVLLQDERPLGDELHGQRVVLRRKLRGRDHGERVAVFDHGHERVRPDEILGRIHLGAIVRDKSLRLVSTSGCRECEQVGAPELRLLQRLHRLEVIVHRGKALPVAVHEHPAKLVDDAPVE